MEKEISLDSVYKKSLTKQVVEHILQLLRDSQLRPGDKLPSEKELMEKLNVSRSVLREAFSALDSLGLITRKTREGTYFNNKIDSNPFMAMLTLSADNSPAIIEARMVLELGLVTVAAEKITDQQLNRLKGTIDVIKNNTDNTFGETDKEFHKIIALSANNSVVEGMIHSLLLIHEKTEDHIRQVQDRDITVAHHIAIYNALAKKDPHESFAQMYQHLDYVRKKVYREWNLRQRLQH